MSQVVFKTPKGFEVVAGYDAIDREFFTYVFDARPDGGFKVVWSNLTDFDPVDQHSTARLRKRLDILGIKVPGGFWTLVELKEADSVRHEWNGQSWQGGLVRSSLREVPAVVTA